MEKICCFYLSNSSKKVNSDNTIFLITVVMQSELALAYIAYCVIVPGISDAK